MANFQKHRKSIISCIDKALFSNRKNIVQAKQWLDKCYLGCALLEATVKRWYAKFKPSHTDTNDAECSGRPKSTVVPENTKSLHQLVLANYKLKLYEIREELKISEGSVFTILHEHLSMRKLCSQSIKNNASTIQSVVCNCFNTTKNKFLFNI